MNAEDWRPITTLPMPDQYPVMVFSTFKNIWRVNNLASLQKSPEITHWTPFVEPASNSDRAFEDWWEKRCSFYPPLHECTGTKLDAKSGWKAALAWKEGRT